MTSWLLPGFSCRDLVAVLVKYFEDETKQVVICSAYLPYDSEGLSPTKELEELVRYREQEHLYPIIGRHSNAQYTAWGSTDCNGREEALVEFLGASNLEILNQGNEPTFSNGFKLEVIDIPLTSFGLLKSIMNWGVSVGPALVRP
jgi:hypothetical protein